MLLLTFTKLLFDKKAVWCRKREFLGIQAELSRSWNIGSSICRYIPRIDEFTRRGQKMRFKCIQKTYFW